MIIKRCLEIFCFVPLDESSPKFFGFSEYLAALALMVVVWTTSDIRYRFRIATAPLPLHRLTFVSIASVGVLTLLTDLWRAEGWLVPKGSLLTPSIWQAVLGVIFLLTFLTWAWFAYMKPPTFGKRNAQRFGSFLYRKIIDGSPTDMATIAQELIRSVPALIKHAPSKQKYLPCEGLTEPTMVQRYANDILLLIADQRFCRTLVESSPGTILELFQEINKTNKYGVSVSQFGRNVVGAAIENPNSFMYHEAEGYTSGLLGYLKPLTQAIFGNYRMADQIDSLLDLDYMVIRKWSASEWEAYNRAVLITLRSYTQDVCWNHSFILSRALSCIESATSDLYKIDGLVSSNWDHDIEQKLRASVDFCEEAIKVLDAHDIPEWLRIRIREGDPPYFESFYDRLVDLIFEIILSASSVKTPQSLCWSIQHNSVWGKFFSSLSVNGKAGKIVKFKLRRKIYDQIVTATKWPNFKNVKILGFCLNVISPRMGEVRDSQPLQKAVLAWTKRNFVSLEARSPQVFDHCLPEGLSYDKENYRLVYTSQVNALQREPEHFYFGLDEPT